MPTGQSDPGPWPPDEVMTDSDPITSNDDSPTKVIIVYPDGREVHAEISQSKPLEMDMEILRGGKIIFPSEEGGTVSGTIDLGIRD